MLCPVWGFPVYNTHGCIGKRPAKSHKDSKRLELLSCEEKLIKLVTFSLEKGEVDLIKVYKYLMRGSKEDKARHLGGAGDRESGNGHRVKYRKCHLNTGKETFLLRGC